MILVIHPIYLVPCPNTFLFSYIPTVLQGEIEAVNIKFMDAVAAQDPTAVSKIYTEDCRLSPPGMDVVIGREGAKVPTKL